MNIERTPPLNIYEEQLNNQIYENVCEKENNKEEKIASEEDRTSQSREYNTYDKREK